jgi:hypothetical protein
MELLGYMRRLLAVSPGVFLCTLVIACPAFAAHLAPVHAARAQAAMGQASGAITAMSGSWFTIQTAGRRTGVVNAMVAAANAITKRDYPYVWGGGHLEAGVANAGTGTKRHRATAVGFDCSGSVAAVLAGAGLWPAGGPVPNDAGIIARLLKEKLIARGPGKGPVDVTLYDHPGVHIFMSIDGRFFGTSDGGGGGSAKGGPGWLYDGASDAFNRAFKNYHVLPSVLRDSTSYGHTLTFRTGTDGSLLQAAALGDEVTVIYSSGGSGTMVANSLTYVGALTTSGTVTSIALDGTSFTVETADGSSSTFSSRAAGLIDALAIGDDVEVTYTASAGELIARDVIVTASAPPATGQTSPSDGSSSAGGSEEGGSEEGGPEEGGPEEGGPADGNG